MKNYFVVKKRTLVIACILLTFVMLSTLIGSRIGYQLGMQTPKEKLVGDMQPGDIANINSVTYGFSYGFGTIVLEITGLTIYAMITHLRKTN